SRGSPSCARIAVSSAAAVFCRPAAAARPAAAGDLPIFPAVVSAAPAPSAPGTSNRAPPAASPTFPATFSASPAMIHNPPSNASRPPATSRPAPMNARALDRVNRHALPALMLPITGTDTDNGLPTRQSADWAAVVCAPTPVGDPGTFGSGGVLPDRNA